TGVQTCALPICTFQEAPGRQPDFQLLAPAALRGRDVLLVDTGNRRIQEQVGGKGLTRGARGRGIQVDGAYEVGDFITLRPGRAGAQRLAEAVANPPGSAREADGVDAIQAEAGTGGFENGCLGCRGGGVAGGGCRLVGAARAAAEQQAAQQETAQGAV